MKSLQNNVQTVQTALTAVVSNCFHYWRASAEPPYMIWAEDSEETSFHSSNRKQEQQIHGTADYFTKTEFDETVDDIQEALNDVCGWRLKSVQYEDETGLIHYEWEWWIA